MDKKKKSNIFQNHEKEIVGFESVIEEFIQEQDEAKLKAQISNDKNYDSFKNFNHLEMEKNRIQKLGSMITKKIPNVIEHDQSEAIMEKFTVCNFNLKQEVLDEIKKFDSTFNKNIRLLFNKAFRKK